MAGKPVVRKPFALYCDDVSRAKQSFKEECDINYIVGRAVNGGAMPNLNARVPMYADVSNIPDYRSSIDTVNRANGLFMDLSADVRRYFGNDPARFVEFVSDPKNRDESIRLGLAKAPEPEPVAAVVPVVPEVKPKVEPKAPVDAKGPILAPLAGAQ